jgi:hypothetical protein
MSYKTRIAIAPDVEAELRRLKALYGLQSANKVLRRVLLCDSLESHGSGAEGVVEGERDA